MSRKIVKWMINVSGVVLLGSAFLAIRKQVTVTRAHKIREHQRRYGSDFQLSEDKQQLLRQADEYLDNHVGRKLASMMRTQKQTILSTLTEDDKDKMDQLKGQIEQLNKVYAAVKPKRITSWEELRQKDQEQEGY